MENVERQNERGIALINAAGINPQCNEYGLEELTAVQQYYDQQYPGLYRIVVFNQETGPVPFWKGADHKRQLNVAIINNNGHFDGIKNIEGFFKMGKQARLCIDCGIKYYAERDHCKGCPAR
jgi:hypothetical protein